MTDEEKIEFIMKETDYSRNDVEKLMDIYDGDYMNIIKHFYTIIPEKKQNKSVNQEIFSLIRKKIHIEHTYL
jgi:hypothetical protein